MKQLYYVDKNGVLEEVVQTDQSGNNVRGLFIDAGGIFYNLRLDEVFDDRKLALEAQRDILAADAKRELNNIFLANQRHQNLMKALVELDIELYELRKEKGPAPLTDNQVKL